MYGAVLGDVIGSRFEFDRSPKRKDFELFCVDCSYTDDSVMTLAVAQALMEVADTLMLEDLRLEEWQDATEAALIEAMREYGRRYPHAGYGLRFGQWLRAAEPRPYRSYGNGSAMRASAAGWIFASLEETLLAADLTARVTHDHPEGIKGAQATAAAIYLARTGHSKEEIRRTVCERFHYDLDRTCDEIRPGYHHVESCQETVPEAIIAFLEGTDFEDVIRNAVSLGGDCDTLCCIAASIAEAYYGVGEDLRETALSCLPEDLREVLRSFGERFLPYRGSSMSRLHQAMRFAEDAHHKQKRKGGDIPYITHPMEVYQILTEMGAGEDLLIAGLLHDTVEDTQTLLEDIAFYFGDHVAFLVDSHSEDKRKPWRERKQATIEELRMACREVKLLILADKVSNLRSMHHDYQRLGDALWDRFSTGRAGQEWYHNGVLNAMADLEEDRAARAVYWECQALYKELFVDYYLDREYKTLYQTNGSGECYRFQPGGSWEAWEGEIPPSAERLTRAMAEAMEDLWQVTDPRGE